MGKQERRGRSRQVPDIRSEQILAAAITLFAQRGYRATDLQAIAEAAGIAKGTVYLYFKSKQQLFLAAVDRAFQRLAESIEQEVTTASGPLEKIKAVIRAYMRFFDEDRPLAEMMAREQGEFSASARQTFFYVFSENAGRLEAILREGIAQGVFRSVDPAQAGETLANLLYGSIYTQVAGRIRGHAIDVTDGMIDFVLHGIAAPSRPRRN